MSDEGPCARRRFSLSALDEARYERLLARVQRVVQLESTEIEIAGHLYPWTRVVDPDALLLQALSEGEQGTVALDPFWAASWRAAVGMDRYLARLENLSGTRVLELGGGSGRAGIAAALHGAKVTITDAVPTALLVCRYNARYVEENVYVRYLDWADPRMNADAFPIIIGSDIVYDPKLFPILEPCFRRQLKSGGQVLLSEPQRHTGDRFAKWIRAAGWKCSTTLIDLEDGEREIRIFQLTC